jgi:hypothetical protein
MESGRTTVFNWPGLVSRDLPAAAPHSFVVSGFPGHISGVFDTIYSSCSVSQYVSESVIRCWVRVGNQ